MDMSLFTDCTKLFCSWIHCVQPGAEFFLEITTKQSSFSDGIHSLLTYFFIFDRCTCITLYVLSTMVIGFIYHDTIHRLMSADLLPLF